MNCSSKDSHEPILLYVIKDYSYWNKMDCKTKRFKKKQLYVKLVSPNIITNKQKICLTKINTT